MKLNSIRNISPDSHVNQHIRFGLHSATIDRQPEQSHKLQPNVTQSVLNDHGHSRPLHAVPNQVKDIRGKRMRKIYIQISSTYNKNDILCANKQVSLQIEKKGTNKFLLRNPICIQQKDQKII